MVAKRHVDISGELEATMDEAVKVERCDRVLAAICPCHIPVGPEIVFGIATCAANVDIVTNSSPNRSPVAMACEA